LEHLSAKSPRGILAYHSTGRSTEVNSYELTVIFRVSDALESSKEKVKSILQKYGITVQSEDSWGVKRLAYIINGERDGVYHFMVCEGPPDAVSKVTGEFRLTADILRFLFVKPGKKKTA
jgi:small subunit ribosomal protein S6